MSITVIRLDKVQASTRAALIEALTSELFDHIERCEDGCDATTTCAHALGLVHDIERTRRVTIVAARVA